MELYLLHASAATHAGLHHQRQSLLGHAPGALQLLVHLLLVGLAYVAAAVAAALVAATAAGGAAVAWAAMAQPAAATLPMEVRLPVLAHVILSGLILMLRRQLLCMCLLEHKGYPESLRLASASRTGGC